MPVVRYIKKLAKGFYRYSTFLLPVKPTKIVFISFPDVADNAVEIARELTNSDDRYELVWLVQNETEALTRLRRLGLDEKRIHLAKAYSVRGLYHALGARLVFHTHGLLTIMSPREGQLIVNLWHGMPIKTIGTYDPNPDYGAAKANPGGVTIATSRLFRRIMAKAFDLAEEDVWLTGQPRTDRLVRFAEDMSPQYILWMPTYRVSSVGALRSDGRSDAVQKMLDDFAQLDRLVAETAPPVMIKLHPMDILNHIELPSFRRIRVIRAGDPEAADLESLVAGAKALITDFSSAAVDFAILRRPIGFYLPDYEDYGRGLIPEVVEELGFFGPRLTRVEDLAMFVSDTSGSLPDPDKAALLHEHYDAGAARRVVSRALEAIAGER